MSKRAGAGRVGRQEKPVDEAAPLDGLAEAVTEEFTSDESDEQAAVRLERQGTLRRIRLQGAVDIASAAELKRLLLEALAEGSELQVSCERVEDLDVTAVQLLAAARRAALAAGKEFVFTSPPPADVVSSMAEVGLGCGGVAEAAS